MKRFLVFCLICIVTACLGLLTFRFLTLEESVVVNQRVFEVNINEEIPLEITVLNSKGSKPKVTISNTDLIIQEDGVGNSTKFFAKDKGGQAKITIEPLKSTSAPIIITVTIGDGTEQSPYFIRNAEDLAQIGVPTTTEEDTYYARPLDAYYKLINDIDMSLLEADWTAIGSVENAFTGILNGNNHTISNLSMTGTAKSAGLFAKIGANSQGKVNVYGLTLDKANISGEFDYAGILAGVNSGSVEKVTVVSSLVSSTKANASVGGVFGAQNGKLAKTAVFKTGVQANASNTNAGGIIGLLQTESVKTILDRSYAEGVDVSGNYNVGGLVGLSNGGIIVNSYSKFVKVDDTVFGKITSQVADANVSLGGLVGRTEITGGNKSTVVDCYAVVKVEGQAGQKCGQLVGYVADQKTGDLITKNDIYGLYYEKSNSSLLAFGYINNVTETTEEAQKSAYPYIYNDLKEQATTKEVLYSHNSVDKGDINWSNEVWTLLKTDYPTLNFDTYFDIQLIIGSIYDEYTIENVNDLINLRSRVNSGEETTTKTYTIVNNIDLSGVGEWTPIGTSEHPFTSILTCPIDETTGMPIYKITGLKISAAVGDDDYASTGTRYQGLFGVIAGSGRVSNLYIENPQVRKGQYIGGVAAVNYGVIDNCYVIATNDDATIETKNVGFKTNDITEDLIYIGGIVGYNSGTVAKCQVKGMQIQQIKGLDKTVCAMGGIVGFNNGSGQIDKCAVIGFETGKNAIISNEVCTLYVGGIAGRNNSNVGITSCYTSRDIQTVVIGDSTGTKTYNFLIDIATGNKNAYVGGIVGLNEKNSVVKYSFSNIIVEGTYVGGVCALTYGEISECYSVSDLTGYNVGGVVYKVENGVVANCYAGGNLLGVSKNSVKAGIAVDIALISKDDRNACVKNCFSYAVIGGDGKDYYDTACLARRDSFKLAGIYPYNRVSGYMINCIFDRSVTNAERSNDKFWSTDKFPWKDTETLINDHRNDPKQSYLKDCGMTTEQILSEDGIAVFEEYGFVDAVTASSEKDIIWVFKDSEGNVQLPQLKNVVKM